MIIYLVKKIFLNSSNDLGMEEIWDRKEYLEYFFPFDLKEKFKFKGNDITIIKDEEVFCIRYYSFDKNMR